MICNCLQNNTGFVAFALVAALPSHWTLVPIGVHAIQGPKHSIDSMNTFVQPCHCLYICLCWEPEVHYDRDYPNLQSQIRVVANRDASNQGAIQIRNNDVQIGKIINKSGSPMNNLGDLWNKLGCQ